MNQKWLENYYTKNKKGESQTENILTVPLYFLNFGISSIPEKQSRERKNRLVAIVACEIRWTFSEDA